MWSSMSAGIAIGSPMSTGALRLAMESSRPPDLVRVRLRVRVRPEPEPEP